MFIKRRGFSVSHTSPVCPTRPGTNPNLKMGVARRGWSQGAVSSTSVAGATISASSRGIEPGILGVDARRRRDGGR